MALFLLLFSLHLLAFGWSVGSVFSICSVCSLGWSVGSSHWSVCSVWFAIYGFRCCLDGVSLFLRRICQLVHLMWQYLADCVWIQKSNFKLPPFLFFQVWSFFRTRCPTLKRSGLACFQSYTSCFFCVSTMFSFASCRRIILFSKSTSMSGSTC